VSVALIIAAVFAVTLLSPDSLDDVTHVLQHIAYWWHVDELSAIFLTSV
jgi:hypothetical protein